MGGGLCLLLRAGLGAGCFRRGFDVAAPLGDRLRVLSDWGGLGGLLGFGVGVFGGVGVGIWLG